LNFYLTGLRSGRPGTAGDRDGTNNGGIYRFSEFEAWNFLAAPAPGCPGR